MFKHLIAGLVAGLMLLLPGCSQKETDEWKNAAVAPLKPGTSVKLRVVHANNPRLARFSPDHLRIVLASAQLAVWKHFGTFIEFTEVEETDIDDLFVIIPASIRKERIDSIYDFKLGQGDPRMLAEGIERTLTERKTRLQDAQAFAGPYLPGKQYKDLTALSEGLSIAMLERLSQWRQVAAADGAPVIDASPYNEWVYWDTLGYGNLQYDLVLTNQLIASAEYYGVDIHSAIRGGVSVGTTSYSRNSRFGSFVFMTTFPFLDNSAVSMKLREGEQYSEEYAAELAGAYLAHEIGHLLFQFGHPFGQKSCAMNPARMLRFREWYEQIDPAGCQIGSRPEMKAGAIPPSYNLTWVRKLNEQASKRQ